MVTTGTTIATVMGMAEPIVATGDTADMVDMVASEALA